MENCNNTNCCSCACDNNISFGTSTGNNNKNKSNHIIYGDSKNGYNTGDLLDANAITDLIISLTLNIITWKYVK